MSNSKENDNGRYFEYIVTEKIKKDLGVSLTARAQTDQDRDKIKKIDPNVIIKMDAAAIKISNWVSTKINAGSATILDRHPDKEKGKKTHEDISITDQKRQVAFSLKHNHEAIFHGRIFSSNNWIGLNKEHPAQVKFKINKQKIISDLHRNIPIDTKFADKGIKEQYQDFWSDFIYKTHENAKQLLVLSNSQKNYIDHLFNTIIGNGSNQYRVLKIGNKVVVQDLNNISQPSSVKIDNIQIKSTDSRSKYVWHLVFTFDNGLKVSGRSKQDSSTMKSVPSVKHDWQIKEFGKSGILEKEL